MIQVSKKGPKEPLENLLRRFGRKVQQSSVLANAKEAQHFAKPISKPERRRRAIIKRQRKAIKVKRMKLGLK